MIKPLKPKYTFIDFSKTEEGKQIFEKNQEIWTDKDYFKHVRALKEPKEIELAQIIRKY